MREWRGLCMNSSYEFWRAGCEEFAFGGRELKPPLERRG
jgi:hypothetical protein